LNDDRILEVGIEATACRARIHHLYLYLRLVSMADRSVHCKATQQFAMAATNWNKVGRVLSCPIGSSHGELGRFATRSDGMRSD